MEAVGQRANELLTELKIYVFVIRGLSQPRDRDRNLLDPRLRVDRSLRLTVEFETTITFESVSFLESKPKIFPEMNEKFENCSPRFVLIIVFLS